MDQHGCTGFRRAAKISRREVLRLGGACGLGLTLSDLLRAQAQPRSVSSRTFGQTKSVIVLYLHGGHAQQETWDPKPDGPSPARGEFGAIATSVPGVHISELLPRSARLMHKLAVIRSLTHGNANHVQASLDALTGHSHPPEAEARGDFPPSPADFPPFGATQFGQRCLLARRLAEAGVPIINVQFCHTPDGSWDTHSQHFRQMKDLLCPTFDQAFAALVDDLDQRGLLAQTLVLATAEFGRTPRVNNSAGRDHWPWVYSVAMAGGGTRPGTVLGASDGIAAYPTANPHDPRDLAATVYHLLGVPPDTLVYDQTNRPHTLVVGQ